MKHPILLWLTLLLSLTAQRASAQKDAILLLTNPQTDFVELRWAPNTLALWQQGNKYGYKVERFLYAEKNGKPDTAAYRKGQLLTPEPLKPLPEAGWDKLSEHNDYAAVVQALIYDKAPRPEAATSGRAALLQYRNEMNTRFGFALFVCDLSTEVAKAHGLYFKDETALPGNRYIYKVTLARTPANMKYEPGTDLVDPKDVKQLAAPRELLADFSDSMVILSWNTLWDKSVYSGYFVERSADGQHFVPVNDAPHVQVQNDKAGNDLTFFRDSLKDNNSSYYYRVRGITPFATYGPYSAVVSGKGIAPLKGAFYIEKDSLTSANQVYLQWRYEQEDKLPLKKISIWRAPTAEGPFEEIKTFSPPLMAGSFTDTKPLRSNYYRLEAEGPSRQRLKSIVALVTTIDSIPPAAPSGLKGKIDSAGKVLLTWTANTEDDLQGYRIFRVNKLSEEPVEITTRLLEQNAYMDTLPLNTLDNEVYYFVMATDIMYNPSPLSKPLLLVKPDTIPPAAPVISRQQYKDGIVLLDFKPSFSKDISYYTIYRLDITANTWLLLDSFGARVHDFSTKDTIEEVGHKFRYKITASDAGGNKVDVLSGDIDTETGHRPALKGIRIKADRDRQLVNLQWDYKGGEKLAAIMIYRAKGTEPLLLVETLKYDGRNNYEDKAVQVNNEYSYSIKGIFSNEAETKISEPVKVVY